MNNVKAFDMNVEEYESWFTENQHIYQSEVEAIKSILPPFENGIEIGVGTGLFAGALGVRDGIEPSSVMAQKAKTRGIKVIEAYAENLPVADGTYDFVLMVTVECFFKDVRKAFTEVWRILKQRGFLIIAFIDRETTLGKIYENEKHKNAFYKNAHFRSAKEIMSILTKTGFSEFDERQTVFSLENELHQVKAGFGEGVFAVIKAQKI